MRITTFFLLIFTGILAGCNSKGEPVEFTKACDQANEKKVIELTGFIRDKGGVFCSNIGGGRLECGFTLTTQLGEETGVKAEIEQGTGANTVEKLPSGFKKEDIRIHDNNGDIIALSDKVKLTGKMSIGPNSTPCFMQVTKIEK
ncbi:MAG: hypothetical protein H7070_13305 [Saprospiraceae bacterium]|nr:hypothetical protein [Pyrinomonadaceae bacterium]